LKNIIKKILLFLGLVKEDKLVQENTKNKNHSFFAINEFGLVVRVDKEDVGWRKGKRVVKKRKRWSYCMALNQKNAIKVFKRAGHKPIKFIRPDALAKDENVYSTLNGGVTAFKVLNHSELLDRTVEVEVISDESELGLKQGDTTFRDKKQLYKITLA
jgi:hypothetical protein